MISWYSAREMETKRISNRKTSFVTGIYYNVSFPIVARMLETKH